jgi:hypothetical protein
MDMIPENPSVLWILALLVFGMIGVSVQQARLLSQLVKLIRSNGFQTADRDSAICHAGMLRDIRDEVRLHRQKFDEHCVQMSTICSAPNREG